MQPYKIDKPIRLIELFAGIGSQAMALRNLGADFTTYRTCEWWIQPNASYKAIHCADDTKDYSADFSKEQIAEKLSRWGISNNGKDPMAEDKNQEEAGMVASRSVQQHMGDEKPCKYPEYHRR